MGKSIISQHSIEEVEQLAFESSTMKEFAEKLGYSLSSIYSSQNTIRTFCKENNISLEHFKKTCLSPTPTFKEDIFIKDSNVSQKTLREWYLKGGYSPYKCAICGMEPFWNGKEITLTLDHINGDNKDDRVENLRWICPNCDRQLPTYAGKNVGKVKRINAAKPNFCKCCGKEIKKGSTLCSKCYGESHRKVERPSKEELEETLISVNGNFTEVGRIYGVNDNSIRKWCSGYGLPTHSGDYKSKQKSSSTPRKKVNYLEVIETYKKEQNITRTSEITQVSPDTVSDILKQSNIPIKSVAEINKEKLGKKVVMSEKDTEKIIANFSSINEAAMYLSENGISKSKDVKGIASHIGQACSGKRKTAYGYVWQFLD